MSLSSGIKLGHYRILEKLGAGGMGKVFLDEGARRRSFRCRDDY